MHESKLNIRMRYAHLIQSLSSNFYGLKISIISRIDIHNSNDRPGRRFFFQLIFRKRKCRSKVKWAAILRFNFVKWKTEMEGFRHSTMIYISSQLIHNAQHCVEKSLHFFF